LGGGRVEDPEASENHDPGGGGDQIVSVWGTKDSKERGL